MFSNNLKKNLLFLFNHLKSILLLLRLLERDFIVCMYMPYVLRTISKTMGTSEGIFKICFTENAE